MKRQISAITALLFTASLLTGCSTSNSSSEISAPADSATEAVTDAAVGEGYKILVTDASGAPVTDVSVQFCSDTECRIEKTGTDGIAAFAEPEGSYTVHILQVPDGFAADGTEYTVPETFGTMTIVLKTADSDVPAEESEHYLGYAEMPEFGLTFQFPAKYHDAKGVFYTYGEELTDTDAPVRVSISHLAYTAISPAEFDDFNSYAWAVSDAESFGDAIPDPPDAGWSDIHNMIADTCLIFTVTGTFSKSAADYILEDFTYPERYAESAGVVPIDQLGDLQEIGQIGETTFLFAPIKYTDEQLSAYESAMGKYFDEFCAVRADTDTLIDAFTLSEPESQNEEEFSVPTPEGGASFETADLDGNTVQSTDLFKDHKVTMVNLWATWCGPCTSELGELGTLANEFEEKDCQIVGICLDAGESDAALSEAKSLLAENGCTYTNLIGTEEILYEIFVTNSIPATYFLDSDGNFLADPIIGAQPELYPQVLDECLEKLGE